MIVRLLADTGGEVSHDTLLTVVVSLFALAAGSPLAVAYVQTRTSRRDRQQDVADRRRVAEELVREREQLAAELRVHRDQTRQALGTMHALLNGNLTRVMRQERDAVAQALGAISEAIDMKLSAGAEVLPESFSAQAQLDHQLAALDAELASRTAVEEEIARNGRNR